MTRNEFDFAWERLTSAYPKHFDKKSESVQRREWSRVCARFEYKIFQLAIDEWFKHPNSDFFPKRETILNIYRRLYSELRPDTGNHGDIVRDLKNEGWWRWTTNQDEIEAFRKEDHEYHRTFCEREGLPYPCLTKEDIQAHVDWVKRRGGLKKMLKQIPDAPAEIVPPESELENLKAIKQRTEGRNQDLIDDLNKTEDNQLPF